MISSDKNFEKQWGEYLTYLYTIAQNRYGDCPDIESLIQDTLTIMIIKLGNGEKIEYPKGFLSAVLKNKYNEMLRKKYRADIVCFDEYMITESADKIQKAEESADLAKEYESVRMQIGRLIKIYREVTVRYYVHGQSVEEIATALDIPKGTVLSRLSSAREQIKEGINNMEKYSQISYEPKSTQFGIWGNNGKSNEPFSLLQSKIESNILILAYESPISIKTVSDTMGIPCAYIEPIIEKLIDGELLGKTPSGLIYTRCYVQKYEDKFGNISEQEKLAEKYAKEVWNIFWKNIEPLTKRDEFNEMSEKQKATLLLFLLKLCLSEIHIRCTASKEKRNHLPERPNAGKWFATLTILEHDQKTLSKYEASGPVQVSYSNDIEHKLDDCKMYDFQSVFGDTHYAYDNFKYKFNLNNILRFYASLLPCDVKPDSNLIYELIPEFEKLHIVRRESDGKIKLDVPALSYREYSEYWQPIINNITEELSDLISGELTDLYNKTKNRIPKYVDGAEYYLHEGALGIYSMAQLLEIVTRSLLPYPVIIGETPIIFILYRKKEN